MGSDLSSITSKLSLAGTWSPIGSANAQGSAVPIANVFYSLITMPNGDKGIVMNGWAYDG